ncbi:hypothetical protein TrLO_g12242 [Triparma laevis f. longispina]|uniref:ADP,ATP carrier protein n=1 Tax=Triparma laevis f. longispina TaxID=1714387 RepID=A0A9W7FG89_9STRA|nr:hypothetical protein TrLO_g12242 [Triparma laevis f. longispina]
MSGFRNAVFPIYGREEIIKFWSVAGIKFFIVFVLTLTRDTKDTLMVTQCGAESIAFMKVYGVLPCAAIFIALYSKLDSYLGPSRKQLLYYLTVLPFFSFFLVFTLIIYPSREALQPSYETVSAFLGMGGVLAKIGSNWTSAMFYIISELYSSVSIGILFWGYANEVVGVEQARRFYPLFGQMSSLGPIAAGQYVVQYSSKAENFQSSLNRLTFVITLSGIMIVLLRTLSASYIRRTEPASIAVGSGVGEGKDKKKKSKPKLSMIESVKFLAGSKYLRLLAMMVIGYGLSINFTEIIWKSLVKKQYPSTLEYSHFMGVFSSVVGVTTFFVIFAGGTVIKTLGWKYGALATPSIMSLLAIPFFSAILIGGVDNPTSLKVAVGIGCLQSILSKATKYAFFDPTTQMAYIPLDEESKVKGKAAIDVLGSRLGKSGGSFIQQMLVLGFGNIITAAPAVVVIFYSVLVAWISSANKLSVMFNELTAQGVRKKSA